MKKGFTLIEILVSMTILVLTISIALFATVGSSGLIQRADSRSSITESGRTISDTIRQIVSNAAVGTVALPTADSNGGTSMLAKTYASDKSQNVCHVIGRADKNDVDGKISYTQNQEGQYIAYWIVPLGSSLECPENFDTTASVIFQNQLTSDKTAVTELRFSLRDYCKTGCVSLKQELRYRYTIELTDKSIGQTRNAQQSSIQTASSVPIGLVNESMQKLVIDTPTELPDTYWGDTYYKPVVVTGGVPPYKYTQELYNLPADIYGPRYGIFNGVTKYSNPLGTYTYRLKVTDSDTSIPKPSVVRTFTLKVIARDLAISTTSLPHAFAGKPYTHQLTTIGGTPKADLTGPTISWSLDPDSSPGFTINPSTGLLSMANPTVGSYNVEVQASDGTVGVTKNLTLLVVVDEGPQ